MKTKCAVIQDDILAVKHALANGIAFEALEGDDLKELLATLQAQRAEVIAASKRGASASSGGGGGSSLKPPSPKPAPKRSAPKSSQGVQPAKAEAPVAKDKPAGGVAAAPKRKSTPTKRPAPAARPQALQQQQQQEKVVKKPKVMSTAERLRLLRKSIRVRDVVSVLMDIPVTGAWIRSWVRGEVTREMNRSGIFQIAFDHDKHGEGTVKMEPSEGEDEERWIHEQRLEIDHPDFFCGQGSDPPRGPDDSRPRGSWYLHQPITYSNGEGN